MASLLTLVTNELEALCGSTPGVTGYCLITADGHLIHSSRGPLAEELAAAAANAAPAPPPSAAAAPCAAVSQFLRPFNTLQPTVAFTALGGKLQVFHQTEGSVFALGQRRLLGLGVCLVPQGVAVVTFDRSLPPPAAVSAAERCAAAIRARCAAA